MGTKFIYENDVLVGSYNVSQEENCSTFYPGMQYMAKVSEMYVRHHGTALLCPCFQLYVNGTMAHD